VQSAKLSITNTTGGSVQLRFTNNSGGESLSLHSVQVEYANDIEKSMQAVAGDINKFKDQTGISARAVVESTGSDAVQAGTTSSTFTINGVGLGTVTSVANDSDGALTNAINNKTSSTGVTAAITSSGQLQLSSDGRPIEVTGAGDALSASDAGSVSTFGHIQLYQRGSYSLDMDDLSSGLAVSFTSNLDFSGTMTSTIDSTLTATSVLGATSTLTSGFSVGAILTDSTLNGNITTTATSTLKAATALSATSILAKDSDFGGSGVSSNEVTSTGTSLLAAGSILISGSTLAAGTYLTNDISTAGGPVVAGTTLTVATTTNADTLMTNAMLLQSGSILGAGSTFAQDSTVGGDVTLASTMTLSQEMSLLAGSTIVDGAGLSLAVGSTIGGAATIAGSDVTLTSSMTLKAGSVLSATSSLATGSAIGGAVTLNGAHIANADLSLAVDTVLAAGTVLEQGTELTNDIVTTLGTIAAGTVLGQDYTTQGVNTLLFSQTVKSGSILADTSVLAANSGGGASTELTEEAMSRLTNLSVLTQEDAQAAMEIADAALADLSAIRSDIGATQNQFTSAVSYLSVSKLNLESATSSIMDVDLAEESMIFARMQVLTQTGAFALSQANVMSENVLSLFQGS
nr:flagellin [Spirochaetales bacterium]